MKWIPSRFMLALAVSGLLFTRVPAQTPDKVWWEDDPRYSEEEWYDPSEWFDGNNYEYEQKAYSDDSYYDAGRDVEDDFGNDDRDFDDDYDYYDDYHYDEDYGYDYDYDHDFRDEYGYNYDAVDYDYDYGHTDKDIDYSLDRRATGEVVALEQIRSGEGAPQTVRLKLRTDDGRTRTIQLGDLAYANTYLPEINKGDRIVIGGTTTKVNGRKMFQAQEIRTPAGSYRIPDYEYDRRIEGRLTGLRKVRLNNGNVDALIANVKPDEGRSMNVLLGSAKDFQEQEQAVRPGDHVRVDGYTRELNGETTFVVQNVSFPDQQQSGRERRQERRDQRQEDRQADGQQPRADQQISQQNHQSDEHQRRQVRGELRDIRTVSIDGEIASIRTTTFRGKEGDYQMAQIRTGQGNKVTVLLGRKDRLNRLSLQQGDEMSVIAHRGRVNDHPAFIAYKVSANGRTADVRSLRSSSNRSRR